MLAGAKTAVATAVVDGDAVEKKPAPLSWPPAKRLKPVLQCAKSLVEWVQSTVLVKREGWVAKSSVDMLTLLRQYPGKESGGGGSKTDADAGIAGSDKKETKDKKGASVTATPTVSGYSPVVAKLVDNLCTLLTPLAHPSQDAAGQIKSQGKSKSKSVDEGAGSEGKSKAKGKETTVAADGKDSKATEKKEKSKSKPKDAGASVPDRSAESKNPSNKRELEVQEDRPQSSAETAGDEKAAAKKAKKSSRKDKDVAAVVVEGGGEVASSSNGDSNSSSLDKKEASQVNQIPDTSKKSKKRKQSSD